MKWMVVAPMYWLDDQMARERAWLYLASLDKSGVPEVLRKTYGIGCQQYQGETVMRIDGLLEFLKEHTGDFTHILFTDAWDVLFIQPFDEIIRRYKRMGSPGFLHAASMQRGNIHTDEFDALFPPVTPFRYFGGGFIAEIPLVVELFGRLDTRNTHEGSTCYWQAWREGWFRPQLDVNCEIFQTVEINGDESYCEVLIDWTLRSPAVYNTFTKTWPGILHFGGRVYVDPVTGKDRIIEPWAKTLRIVK